MTATATAKAAKKRSALQRATATASKQRGKAQRRGTTASKKAPAVSAETHEAIERSDLIKAIDVSELHDHPANPPERVAVPAIADLVESIGGFGQREPVRVRPLGRGGGYQILSGHRRVAACRELAKPVRCEVVDCDDAEALLEVLLGNESRQDLNPIQRAELLRRMIDEGIDRAEAGQRFGLASDSGIKNTLRLLELPQSMRELVADGTLPARAARYVVPFAEATVIVDAWAKRIKGNSYDRRRAIDHPDSFFAIDLGWASANARPVDGKTKYSAGYQYQPARRQFELDDKTRKRLQIVTVPIGKKQVEVAQNVKLFDKLNAPHLVKASSYGGGRSTGKKKKLAGKMTPAAIAAEKRAKRLEADKLLKKRLPVWGRRLKRCALARQTKLSHAVIGVTLPLLTHQEREDSWFEAAAATLGQLKSPSMVDDLLGCVRFPDQFSDRLWRILLWPQRFGWPGKEVAEDFEHPMISDEPPAKLPLEPYPMTDAVIDKLIAATGVSIEQAWRDAAGDGPERDLLREFLTLHTSDQLVDLAAKWKVDISGAGTKAEKVESFAVAEHYLPIPDVIKPAKATKARKRNTPRRPK